MDSSSSPDIDSASKLLADLDLIGRSARNKSMDDMDAELYAEVPDTPDRFRKTRCFGFSSVKEGSGGGLNALSSNRRQDYGRKTNAHQCRDFGFCDLVGHNNSQDENDLFDQARLARSIPDEPEGKSSSQTKCQLMKPKKNGMVNHEAKNSFPSLCLNSARDRESSRNMGKGWCVDREVSFNGGSGSHSKLPLNMYEEEKADIFSLGNVQSNHLNKEKGIDLTANSQEKASQRLGKASHADVPWRNTSYRREVRNHFMSPCSNTQTGNLSVADGHNAVDSAGGERLLPFPGISSVGAGKERDKEHIAFPQRNGQRKLVRNGCISPRNIARHHHTKIQRDQVLRTVYDDCLEESSSHEINILGSVTEERCVDKSKGKAIMDDNMLANSGQLKAKSQPNGLGLLPDEDVSAGAGSAGNNIKSSEDSGLKAARNCAIQASIFSSEASTSVPKGKDIIDIVTDCPEINLGIEGYNPNPARASSDAVSGCIRRSERAKLLKGKRKSSSNRYGECSRPIIEHSEVSVVGSSVQPSNWKSTRTGNSPRPSKNIVGPIIEVDDVMHSPGSTTRNVEEQTYMASDDSSAKARQVESDEILARQLQEQLFNESPYCDDTEEVDATIALSLQQEEDSQRSAPLARLARPHPRDTTMAHLYTYYRRRTSRNASTRPTVRARAPSSSRMAQLRTDSNNSSWRGLERRLNFLEALEAEFNSRNGLMIFNSVYQLHRDFNENDYEMLLALDDNNEHVGASQNQIDGLPLSVIQSVIVEEACAVCLETPLVGDTIRHLPCLHKFHKDCIDTWLKRKTTCPICKFGIT